MCSGACPAGKKAWYEVVMPHGSESISFRALSINMAEGLGVWLGNEPPRDCNELVFRDGSKPGSFGFCWHEHAYESGLGPHQDIGRTDQGSFSRTLVALRHFSNWTSHEEVFKKTYARWLVYLWTWHTPRMNDLIGFDYRDRICECIWPRLANL
jgi:hypothetical protein